MSRQQKKILLSVDIGNSTIGFGLYPDVSQKRCLVVEKIPLAQAGSADTLRRLMSEFLCRSGILRHPSRRRFQDIGVIISSVVPVLNSKIIAAARSFCSKPLIVDYRLAKELSFKVPHPELIGSDRIVNALAGFNLFGKPVAVVDFGTATTITVIGKHADFAGGVIMPGLDMMRESLASKTAKLPIISVSKPLSVLGRETAPAITSGIVHGTAGAVSGILAGIEKETHTRLRLVLTGGKAGIVSPFIRREHVLVPNLIFEGMRLIYIRHRTLEP